MNEDAAMAGENDKEYQKSSYRNLSQCYLTTSILYEMACHWNWDTAGIGRKSIAWAMHGTDQAQVFWDVRSPWYPEHPRRYESPSAPLWETETSQILHFFFLHLILLLQRYIFPSFIYFFHLSHLPSFLPPFKCHICAQKCPIPLFASVSQLTPSYWLLLWHNGPLISGCPSLIAMIMPPLCAWVDWACWLIHRILMQPYTLLNIQTAI